MKKNITILIPIAIIVIGGGILLSQYLFKSENKSLLEVKCNFELLDIQEYKGKYGSDKYANSYIVYEGLLKNNSEREEMLKAMIANVYNEEGVYIGGGYSPVGEFIKPSKSVPFKIHILISTAHDTVIRKYFEESNSFEPDIYPWFTTCK